MRRRILDSCKLIKQWQRCYRRHTGKLAERDITRWANELVELYETNWILAPVAVEFLAGFTSRKELEWGERFLRSFYWVDERNIPPEDWDTVYRLVRRIRSDNKTRQLGDCLIRAIARRLKCEIETDDRGFPRGG
jgi:predicted nucleic acid-binding protein